MKKQIEGKYFGIPHVHLKSTRYNGGWTKEITKIDKTKNNGYSLVGKFMQDSRDTYEVNHLYLDCGIGGSRNNQKKEYILFTMNLEGEIIQLASFNDCREWALNLWKPIEEFFGREKENHLGKYSVEELLAEINRRK